MASQLPADPTQRFFEHYPPGAVFDIGSFSVTAQDIIAFARLYDPQDMHVDPEVAAAGPFGEVIASGWHTVGLMMRLLVANFLPKNGLAAPGIDELRWPRPVRPGDTLNVRVTIQDARLSRSKPDRGLVHGLVEVFNQKGEVVMSMRPMNLVRVRPT
ncbi:MAG: MaoC family dehydratase [Acetobacteraceae bacterium]